MVGDDCSVCNDSDSGAARWRSSAQGRTGSAWRLADGSDRGWRGSCGSASDATWQRWTTKHTGPESWHAHATGCSAHLLRGFFSGFPPPGAVAQDCGSGMLPGPACAFGQLRLLGLELEGRLGLQHVRLRRRYLSSQSAVRLYCNIHTHTNLCKKAASWLASCCKKRSTCGAPSRKRSMC